MLLWGVYCLCGFERLSLFIQLGGRCEKQTWQQKFQKSNVYPSKPIASVPSA